MITVKDIQRYSKEHPIGRGRQTRLCNESIEVSIVGGANGLYGDFIETFELAVFDTDTHSFITKYYFNEIPDDVVSYFKKEELESFLNKVFNKGFQVR